MRSSRIPKARAAAGLAVTATKCSSGSLTPLAVNHSMARAALARDSVVVNDFDEIMTKVSSGSSPSSAPVMACASTFEAKRIVRRLLTPASASTASLGPQSLPPMPRCTTLRYRFCALTKSTKLAKRSCSALIALATPAGGCSDRSAVCQAARFSVQLMASPAKSPLRAASKPCWLSSAAEACSNATE